MSARRSDRCRTIVPRGFTLTEILVVIAVISVLLGLLLVALGAVKSQGAMAVSMSNMRQIGQWMEMYSSDNAETVLPAHFDYTYPNCPDCYRGKVKSIAPPDTNYGDIHVGTWSDILWTLYMDTALLDLSVSPYDYRFDSPDKPVYEELGNDVPNPFRSAAQNTREMPDADYPKPFGRGAKEEGRPGFFAANGFFDAVPPDYGTTNQLRWFSRGKIARPDRSMYLVDSFAGEMIEDMPQPYDNETDSDGNGRPDFLEVDFRYQDAALMLFMDGHVDPATPWLTLDELEERGTRVRNLTSRRSN